jgi:hypothetical protein
MWNGARACVKSVCLFKLKKDTKSSGDVSAVLVVVVCDARCAMHYLRDLRDLRGLRGLRMMCVMCVMCVKCVKCVMSVSGGVLRALRILRVLHTLLVEWEEREGE